MVDGHSSALPQVDSIVDDGRLDANTAASHAPEIDIVFAGIAGVATASGSGLMGGGTSGTLNLSLTNTCAANQILQWNGTAWVCANSSGGGTVNSVGLTAPSTDFLVTGSPVTTSGTLGLGWLVAPDFNNTPGAIVKRDGSGNFSAGTINAATGFNLGSNLFAFGSWANGNAFLGFAGNGTMTGSLNTANGFQALAADTTGSTNTASGFKALIANTTGNQNTASGSQALYYNTGGFNNTALGYNAGPDQSSPSLFNATAIGAYAVVSESNALVLGGTGANAVSVGIGTATPAYTLDVQGTGNFAGLVKFAPGQTFPGVGTITGVTTAAGSGLTGGGPSGTLSLSIPAGGVSDGMLANPSLTVLPGTDLTGGGVALLGGSVALNLDTTKVPQLATANTFTGNQTVNGKVTATSFSGNGAGLTNITVTSPAAMNAALLRWYPQTYPIINGPYGVAFDGVNIWVTNQAGNAVTKLLASSGAVVGSYNVGVSPISAAFDGSNIWVSNEGSATVTKLLASSGAVLGTYPVGSYPYGLAFDGSNIWVANGASNNVTKLLASSGAVLGTYPVANEPAGVAFDGSNIWVANNIGRTVTKLSPSGAVVGTYSVGNLPWGVACDGSNIWVANNADNTVTKLLASSGAVVGTYSVGAGPVAVAFDGSNIWVANRDGNTVTKLLSSGVVLGTYPVGASPYGAAFDGYNIWVANYSGNSVTKIPVY